MLPRTLATALFVCATLAAPQRSAAAVYQWSTQVEGPVSPETGDRPRAFLWVPPSCRHIDAVVVGQHNLLEEPLLEAPRFRQAMARLCMAEVWVSPAFAQMFDFNAGAGERFTAMMRDLAQQSGYDELAFAPIVPVGHSALASYPWNFAAWNPSRTLAVISLKGDAPLTHMTGSGKPNPDWGDRTIDGVPGLMVMGEYEWVEGRLTPALAYQKAHPAAAISFYADAGHGHFGLSDDLVDYIARFIARAATRRLPRHRPASGPVPLIPIDPRTGWRADRWHPYSEPAAPAAPFRDYTGPRDTSFWYFDGEMARRAEAHYAAARGKAPQLLGFRQDGATVPQAATQAQVTLQFRPLDDGNSFRLEPVFLGTVPGESPNPSRWTRLPAGSSLGHAPGPITVTRDTGPVVQTGPDSWTLSFNRTGFDNRRRAGDVWFVATQAGDRTYKAMEQQALLRVPPANTDGRPQAISFTLPDQVNLRASTGGLQLNATSDSGLPVRYYVREGPAEIDGDRLRFTDIPVRAKWPMRITVVAWQYGIAGKVKSADPIERSVELTK